MMQVFQDRRDAGRQLAALLEGYRGADAIVLALPRGGVPVGYEVAHALKVPLDVFVVRKIGAPSQPELGIGAVAPGGISVIDTNTVKALGISSEQIEQIAAAEMAEVDRRLRRFRGDRPLPVLAGKTVIIVDDGLATGVTAYAAIQAIRKQGPASIVLAIPVCASQTAQALRSRVEQLVCVEIPAQFGAVGLWYGNFEQTSDEEVVDLLEHSPASTRTEQHGKNEQAERSESGHGGVDEIASPRGVRIDVGEVILDGDLTLPDYAALRPPASLMPRGVILFAHGSGSSRHSPRNRQVAEALNAAGFATLLMDLLTVDEEASERQTRHLRFDIELLATRLRGALQWLARFPPTSALRTGLFGASTGAGAALVMASMSPESIAAVVSRGGRPDLAGEALRRVDAPTLLLVGELDVQVLALNRQALAQLPGEKELIVVPGASHLFEEPGTLEEVARLSARWFTTHIGETPRSRSDPPLRAPRSAHAP